MKNSPYFGHGGAVVRTHRRWPLSAIVGTALTLIALGLLYGTAQRMDEASDARLAAGELERAAAFEAGRQQGRAELLPTVRQAWQSGLDEGRTTCPRGRT